MTIAAVLVELREVPDLVETFGGISVTNTGNWIVDDVKRALAK